MRLLPPALAALLAGAFAVPATAFADSTSSSGSATQLLVIMDVSGSMKRTDASGTTLIEGARSAVEGLMDELPDDAEVGLRLYGSEYAGDAEAQGCADTELAVPIGPASSTGESITRAIDSARPTGFTPIGRALTEAAGDFDTDVRRSIVLVSDGEDTCGNPAPCEAAQQLSKQGIDVRVDTVGLFLEGNRAATQQLECIAEVTGGSYVGADDAEALAEELTTVSTRAIQRQVLDGEPVQGGPALISATPIEPGTTYSDDIVKGEARWYSFEVEDGQQLKLTYTDDGTTPYGCCLGYALLDPEGDSVQHDSDYNRRNSANTYILETSEDRAEDIEAGTYYVRIDLDDTTSDEDYPAMPFQFVVEVSAPAPAEEEATAAPSDPTQSATAQATDASDEAAAEATDASAEKGVSGLLWALVGLLGLAVLGLGAAVIVLLRRTKPSAG